MYPVNLQNLRQKLAAHNKSHVLILLSEVTPPKLATLQGIDAFIQVACPRLSIDWGEGFHCPVLTPYEALVALGEVEPWWQGQQGQESSQGEVMIARRDKTKKQAE